MAASKSHPKIREHLHKAAERAARVRQAAREAVANAYQQEQQQVQPRPPQR